MTITCAFCRDTRTFVNHGDVIEGSQDGPDKLRGAPFCSFACRASAVLLAHLDVRAKHPKPLMSYETLLGMNTL